MNFHHEQLGVMPSLAMFSPCENREDSHVTGTWVYLFLSGGVKEWGAFQCWMLGAAPILGCRGIVLGVGYSQGMGILSEFSRMWQFTTAVIPMDDCQTHPPWCIPWFTHNAAWLSHGREHPLHRRLFEQYVPFHILLSHCCTYLIIFSPKTKFEKANLLLNFCFHSLFPKGSF